MLYTYIHKIKLKHETVKIQGKVGAKSNQKVQPINPYPYIDSLMIFVHNIVLLIYCSSVSKKPFSKFTANI